MKLLLDESIPKRLAKSFPDSIQVSTVQENGWGGMKNGTLLRTAADGGFNALITADRGFEYQHNLKTLPLSIIILRSHRTRLLELVPLVPKVMELLEGRTEIGVYRVDA
tara:strand:- start:474 stop:800 length:327 start_codon:yes stop_codon:yes gene_type:complete